VQGSHLHPIIEEQMQRKILFVCTGNYYRSRFAEELFNTLAPRERLPWIAESRGTEVKLNTNNSSPIAKEANEGLFNRGIHISQVRYPLQLQEQDVEAASLIIGLQEEEHRSYLETHFPYWLDKMKYWHVPDIEFVPAIEALDQIEREVRALLRRLVDDETGI
jgi:protein-tyrosine phosphatase